MNNILSSKNNLHLIASILSPFISYVGVYIYHSVANASFWLSEHPLEDSSHTSGALMAISEVMEIVLVVTIGCIFGIILAIKYVYKPKRNLKMGIFAILINGLPLLFLTFIIIKGLVYGI